jgi:uncharacterized protein (DUF2236 family)
MPVAALKTRVKRTIENRLDAAAAVYLNDDRLLSVDFSKPYGEPAINAPTSVSWRIFKNPVSLFIGGVAAVILEFAEPRVRAGVWDNTSFRSDPVTRLKRTGLAAMITVYGAQSVARAMIDGVNRRHGAITGVTPSGEHYAASDPKLLTWVQATAGFGFLEAYSTYVAPLSDEDQNRYYKEGQTTAGLYGATDAPASLEDLHELFAEMKLRFERSDIIFEFLSIMKKAAAFPQPAQFAQHSLVRAAVDIIPGDIRDILGLDKSYGLRPFERRVVRRMARRADRLVLRSGPAAQSCRRLGLADDYLYRQR